MNAINSNEQMIQKINEVLQNKKDAIVNIIKVITNFDTYNSLTPNWYYKVLR